MDIQMMLLDAGRSMTGLVVNWFIQSTLLIATGLAVGYWLRNRGSAVQSAVYRTTLVAVLVCPAATWALSLAGISGWSLGMPAAYTYESLGKGGEDAVNLSALQDDVHLKPDVVENIPPASDATFDAPIARFDSNPFPVVDQPLPPRTDDQLAPTVTAQPASDPPPANTAPAEDWLYDIHRFGLAALVASAIWILASGFLLMRIHLAWQRLDRLRCDARPAEPNTLDICRQVAALLRVATPEVLHSPFLPSPCLAGIRRPTVLLPASELSLLVRDVLVHELAHLRRHDCAWNLLRRVATAVLFFQPLAWKLSRRLEATAEEVCDDYVVQYGGDRQEYAHRLVDIAELSAAPVSAAGVGIVSLRSMLARRVTRIMDTSRTLSTRVGSALLAIVLATGLAATLLVGLVGVEPNDAVAEAMAESTVDAVSDEVPTDEPTTAAEDDDTITVRGRVVDPDGEPLAGADVYALRWYWDFGDRKPLAQVQADDLGWFEISYRKSQFFETAGRPDQWREAAIAAFVPGYGPDWVWYNNLEPDEEPTIRLVADDVPIEGRIVDLEGHPVAGATIEIGYLNAPKQGDLTEWLEAVRAGQSIATAAQFIDGMPLFSAGRWQEIVTDTDGRFHLTGIGRERQVYLRVKGPTVAAKTLSVVTRIMEPVNQPTSDRQGTREQTNYGARFEYVAALSRPIEGVVRDAKTGEPIAGAEIWSDKFAGENVSGIHDLRAKSDENGLYRLEGMPKGEGNRIIVVPTDLPYFTAGFDVPDPPGIDPVQLDIELNRGIWVTGHVTDKVTGEGVAARIHYIVSPDNPLADELPEFVQRTHVVRVQDRYRTGPDGRYRVVALPGQGIIGVNTVLAPYPGGQGYDDLPDATDRNSYMKYNGVFAPTEKFPTAVKEVFVGDDDQVVCDFALDPGRRLTLRAVGADGAPIVEEVTVSGVRETHDHTQKMPAAQIELLALRDHEQRTVLLHQPERRLGKALRVTADEGANGPITVQLAPCATITGRLVADGEPVRGVRLRFDVLNEGDFGKSIRSQATNSDGRFTHDAVLPGLPYGIVAEGRAIEFATVASELEVAPGETIDLGTIDVTSDERPEPMRMMPDAAMSDRAAADASDPDSVAAELSTDENGDTITVRGRVVDPDGNAVAGADVLALGWFVNREIENPLATVQTGADGRFEIAYRKSQFQVSPEHDRSQFALIAAFADGFGPDWISCRELDLGDDMVLQLIADVPVEGRVLDLEGRPVAGATITVHRLKKTVDGTLDEWLEAVRAGQAAGMTDQAFGLWSSALPASYTDRWPEFTTDNDGRFRLVGIGRERLAEIRLKGSTVVQQPLRVVTRDMPPISQPSDSHPGANALTNFGARFEIAAAPSRPIEGVVRDAESGMPIAGAQIWSYKFAGTNVQGAFNINVKSDATGRYRLEGMPKGEGNVIAVVPRDLPYFTTEFDVPDPAGIEPVEFDLELNRGTWVTGRVTDAVTGRGVSARLYYLACPDNQRAAELPVFQDGTHVQLEPDRYQTDADGNYRVVALPGRGLVAVDCRDTVYKTRQGYDEISDLGGSLFDMANHLAYRKYNGQRTPTRYDYTAVKEVHVETPDSEVQCDVALQRAVDRRLTLRLVDRAGAEVTGARVAGILEEGEYARDESNAEVELRAFGEDEKRTVLVMHEGRRLGKALQIKATGQPSAPQAVTLEPLATIRGRLVKDGEPIAAAAMRFDVETRVRRLVTLKDVTLESVATDAEGRFTHDSVLAGLSYTISVQGADVEFMVVARNVTVEPGETIDLGTIDVTSDERPEPVRMMPDAAMSDRAAADASDPDSVAAEPSTDDNGDTITVRGRVVEPDGEPVAGAILRLPNDVSEEPVTTRTDVDGRFEIVFDKTKYTEPSWHQEQWRRGYLIASADGYAPTWVNGNDLEKDPQPTLTLARDDVPIRGQVLDLEGNPVPEATVELSSIYEPYTGSLDGLLETVRDDPNRVQPYMNREMRRLPVRWFELDVRRGSLSRTDSGNAIITADEEGRFEISGIGRERVAWTRVAGTDIASTHLQVLTRSEIDEQWERKTLDERVRRMLNSGVALPQVYAATFTHFATPSVPITGVVRDKETGEPIPGIPVSGWLRNTENRASAVSDENGRYELTGLAVEGTFQQLYAGPTGEDRKRRPYLGAQKRGLSYSAASPLSDADTDFELTRGIVVRGRVTDAGTGQGVKARIEYLGYAHNSHLQSLADDLWPYADAMTNDDGEFSVAVLPGPGVLAVWTRLSSDVPDRYRPATPDEFGLPVDEQGFISTTNRGLIRAEHYKTATFIDFEPEEEPAEIVLTVTPITDVVRVRCVDADGQPITGVSVIGHQPMSGNYRDLGHGGLEVGRGAEAYIEIAELGAESRRPVVFRHREKNLAAILFPTRSELQPRLADLARDDDGAYRIPLQPSGTIVGQLVDADGEPLRDGGVELHLVPGDDPRAGGVQLENIPLDREGRFQLQYLPAGGPYWLGGGGASHPGRLLKRDIELAPGETIDLGTIDVTRVEDTSDERPDAARSMTTSAAAAAGAQSTASADDDLITVRGLVVDPDGEQVAGATVFAAWVRERGYGAAERFETQVLAQTSSDHEGTFELIFSTADQERSEAGYGWQVVAFAPSAGPAWIRDMDAQGSTPLRLELTRDAPIHGRVVDLEGNPLPDIRVRLHELFPTVSEEAVQEWIDDAKSKSPPSELGDYHHASASGADARYPARFPTRVMGRLAQGSPALPDDVATDNDGRFQLGNLGINRLAIVEFEGAAIAKSYLQVVTRDMEPIAARPVGFIGIHGGIYYGREFDFVAEAMQPIEGIVTDADTGEPLADVEVRIGQFAGSLYSQSDFLATRTDAEGRYRLVGAPQGGGHRVDVVPNTDQPYFPTEQTLPIVSGSFDPVQFDFKLRRGKWIDGKVVDSESSEPIVDAIVNYLPLRSNKHAQNYPNYRPEIAGSVPSERVRTAEDGRFRVLAIPGAGVVAAIKRSDDRQLYATLSPDQLPQHLLGEGDQLNAYHPWVVTGYHALREVEVDESVDEVEVDLKLTRGLTRPVKLVDANDQPAIGVRVLGRTMATFMEPPLEGSTIEVTGLRPNDERPVAFLHPERRIGRGLLISPGDEVSIDLQPCAVARGRFVDEDGEPVREVEVVVSIVHNDGWGRRLIGDTTNADGRFEVLLPPGLSYYVAHYSSRGPRFSAECEPAPGAVFELGDLVDGIKLNAEETAKLLTIVPGETLDLGTIDVTRVEDTSDERPEPVRMMPDAAMSDRAAADASDPDSVAAEPPTDDNDDTITVRGRVLGPDGEVVAGATVFAGWVFAGGEWPRPRSEPSQQFEHRIIAETRSDAAGEFELTFSKRRPQEGRISHGWHIAAFAPGYGPAWMRDVPVVFENPSPTLKLARDEPIRGRIVDLEGKPLAGVRVGVYALRPSITEQALRDWIADAREKSPPSQLQDYFSASVTDVSGRYPAAFPFPDTRNSGWLSVGSPALPAEIVTDRDGRFQFSNLGANRLAVLRIEGPSVAKSYLQVVTSDMEPLSAKPFSLVGVRNDIYYGREFEYVADPTQPIEGTVIDADTGEPLDSVVVRLNQFAGNTFSQTDFLTTRTDQQGRYRLVGAPQGGGHRIEVVPSTDQPYFPMVKKADSSPDSFDPIVCDFELKRGQWIVGKVTEAASSKPIENTTVEYLPLRSNEHAKDYPNYRPEITGSSPDDRYRTDEDGRFRVLAIPGAGILAAIAQDDDRHRYPSLTVEEVPKHLIGEAPYTNTYHPWTVIGYNALREVELTESSDETDYDLELTPGLIRRLNLVDTDDQPVTGVRVLGRVFPSSYLEPPLDGSSVELIGLGPDGERIVAFLHPESRIGRALLISAGDEMTVELQPCAVVRGRFVDEDGEPISDAAINVTIDGGDNWHRGLVGATTDADGRFEVLLPPGITCRVWHYISNSEPNFSAECDAIPAAVFDLGELAQETKLSTEETAKLIVVKRQEPGRTQVVKSSVDPPFHYAGQVLGADGQPVHGAKVYLAYWYSDQSTPPNARTLATTNADGRFEFTMTKRDYRRTGDSVPPWTWGSIVAVAEGHGAAWAQSVVFETTGAALEDAKQRLEQQGQSVDQLEKRLAAERGPLRIVDDMPLEGRVVDINGQPVAGAKVKVTDVRTGKDGTLDEWEKALVRPGINYYEASRAADKHLYGPFVPAIFRQIHTDDDGRFTLRGLGRERLVNLVVEAEGFETSEVYARTRPGESITIADPLAGSAQIHGPRFTHVAAPSRAVEGVVKDAETGEPIEGVIVTSMRSGVSTAPGTIERAGSDHVRAVTDDEGRYRLAGLPSATRNPLTFQPLPDASYLSLSASVDTTGADSSPVTLDMELVQGVVVAGRVVDKDTDKGVSGQIRYLTENEDGFRPSSATQWRVGRDIRADLEGRFRFVAPKGPGYVTFTAFDDSYLKKVSKPKGTQEMAEDQLYMVGGGPEYHALAKIEPDDQQEEYELELTVERGELITGQLLDPDGQPVTASGGAYVGRVENMGWRPLDGGKFHVLNFDGRRPRQLVFVDEDRKLAGQLLLDAKPQAALSVQLQLAATITGRVIDEDGVPVEALKLASGRMEDLFLTSFSPADRGDMPAPPLPLPPAADGYSNIETDSDGRFTIAGLLPGVEYDLSGIRHTNPFENLNGDVIQGIKLSPGESRDLGTLKLQVVKLAEILQRRQAGTNAPQEKEGQSEAETPQPSPDESQQSVHFEGRVVGPDGKPVAGAKLFWLSWRSREQQRRVAELLATTDADGKFQFTPRAGPDVADQATPRLEMQRVAVIADGFGVELLSPHKLERGSPFGQFMQRFVGAASSSTDIILPPDDLPLRGRIVDIDGQPVSGARLLVRKIDDPQRSATRHPDREAADTGDSGWRRRMADLASYFSTPQLSQVITPATTDADGRFVLRGIGRDRLAELLVEGERIEATLLFARTAAGEPIAVAADGNILLADAKIQPAEFVQVVGPSKPVVGQVVDIDTGEPIPGALVRAYQIHSVALNTSRDREYLATMSDDQGRYRIRGLPIGTDNKLVAIATGDEPYVSIGNVVDTSAAGNEIRQDFRLKRGVWAQGRVYDAETEEPLTGQLSYYIFRDPELEQSLPGLREAYVDEHYFTDADGRFRVPILRARGVLAFWYSNPNDARRAGGGRAATYPRGAGAAEIEGAEEHGSLRLYPTMPHYLIAQNYWRVTEVHPAAEDNVLTVDMPLWAGKSATVRIVDSDGTPLSGVDVRAQNWGWQQRQGPNVDIVGLQEGHERKVLAYHPQQQLAGGAIVSDETTDVVTIPLAPAGNVRGRLVNEDGEPISDATIAPAYDNFDSDPQLAEWPYQPGLTFNPTRVQVDQDGRFQIVGLAPGWKYSARVSVPRRMQGAMNDYSIGMAFVDIVVEPGQSLDLGDVRVTDEAEFAARTQEEPKETSEASEPAGSDAAKPQAEGAVIQGEGRVIGPDGEPVAGAQIFTPRMGDPDSWQMDDFQQVERARTDANGRFEFVVPEGDLPARFERVPVLAFAPGYGVAGGDVPRNAGEPPDELTLQLLEDQVVRGRVIDTEGRPVAGVRLQATLLQLPDDGQIEEFLNGWRQNWHDAPHRMQRRLTVAGSDQFARADTDAEGRFEIRGVGADRIAWLQISGGGIAQSMCFLVTREGIDYEAVNQAALERLPPEMRGSEFRAGRPPRLLGPNFEFVAEPGRTISGTVRDLETGESIAGVQMFAGLGWDSVATAMTDSDGRYQLTGIPKGQTQHVLAMPKAAGALMGGSAHVPDSEGLVTDGVDFALPRGVVITGRVVDAKSGEGVPAGVRFAPLAGNEYFDQPGYDEFRGNRLTQSTDEQGRFRLVTIPGPGVLLVQASGRRIEIGGQQLNPYKQATLSAEDRQHVPLTDNDREQYITCADNSIESLGIQNAAKYLDNPPGDEPVECELVVDPGQQTEIHFVDDRGQPITGVTVAGVTDRGLSTYNVPDERCVIYALDPDSPRTALCFHRERRLAGSVTLTGAEQGPVECRLSPVPRIVGRAVDTDGEPVANSTLQLWLRDDDARELERYLLQTREPLSTDDEGQFELTEIVPGFEFRLALGPAGAQLVSDLISKGLSDATDGVIDLGDILVKPRR